MAVAMAIAMVYAVNAVSCNQHLLYLKGNKGTTKNKNDGKNEKKTKKTNKQTNNWKEIRK